jgi:heat shock protein HslJ
MKKLFIATLAALVLGACSNGSNEDEKPGNLPGTWECISMSVMGQEIPMSALGYSLTLTFKTSGEWTGVATGDGMPGSGGGTYSVSGNTITIKEQGYTYYWGIEKLTESSLTVSWVVESIETRMNFKRK